MQVYLVGGAVRDEQLGLPVKERDWCVVGATPEQLEGQGYRRVGKDFPVFLHPDTGEEYALARTERKTAAGYHGFEFHASPDVTIEEDLSRRDLTINAIARDADGCIIDPYGGTGDIQKRLIRHVSAAFAEDPVRILRAARFAARFAPLGFRIAPETRDMMRQMVASGEADALVPDRVWKEMEQALREPAPRMFFEALRACGALRIVLPEVGALFGLPQPARWHPEIDCGVHAMMAVEQAAKLSADAEVRFAALVHDLGKATTRAQDLPSHPGHEDRSCELIRLLAGRLPVPNAFRDLALIAARFHTHCHRATELRDATLVELLDKTDAFRRPERFGQFLLACMADARGRTGFEQEPYPQADYLHQAREAASGIDSAAVARAAEGGDVGEAIRLARVDAVRRWRRAR